MRVESWRQETATSEFCEPKLSIVLTSCGAKAQKGAHCDIYRDMAPLSAQIIATLRVARLIGGGGVPLLPIYHDP
jgi:hypothetical protein